MGNVYEAVDRELHRSVALKMLPRAYDPSHEPIGVRMFVQEARIAAKLAHPNIVTIYEIGKEEGHYYFAMERVYGVTLAAVIEHSGPLPAAQACYVIAHAARALAAAHQAGIVHRDVKPSNIMIDRQGHVKVTDFGLADVEGIDGVAEARDRPLGTPGWIAPEVAQSRRATAASDIYSLGLVLYACLTGRKLVHAETKSGMIRMHQFARSIRRDQLPAGWPPRLADIVVQCLQVDPKDRYQSADMLAMDLARALTPDRRDATLSLDEPASPLPAAGKSGRAVPQWASWLALGALALVAAAFAVWYWLLIR
jgi:serine/threonine-protein kinase